MKFLSSLSFLALLLVSSTASAALVVNQPSDNNPLNSRASQNFSDLGFSYFEFDDFTLNQTMNLGAMTAFGSEAGDQSFNVVVSAGIFSAPGVANLLFSVNGTEDANGDLQFDWAGLQLGPGTYWMAAAVLRPFASPAGGQWFWDISTTSNGSESYFEDTSAGPPVLGSVQFGVAADMAFTLDATPANVPEPTSMVLGSLMLMGLGAGAYNRREN